MSSQTERPLPSSAANSAPASPKKRDRRWLAIILSGLVIAGLGYGFRLLPGNNVVGEVTETPAADFARLADSISERQETDIPVPVEEQVSETAPNAEQTRHRLKEASQMIRARRHDDAINHLNAVRDQIRAVPQTYLVLGRALEGKGDFATARDFYNEAINRNPALSDAYWGFATSSESLGDLPSALGAMRSYLHTEPNADPYRRRIAQARSAIWEWESKLGRGPWGPSKGLPPGFSEAELRRDNRGVGVKMPIAGSENAASVSKYEIKSADKVKIYPR